MYLDAIELRHKEMICKPLISTFILSAALLSHQVAIAEEEWHHECSPEHMAKMMDLMKDKYANESSKSIDDSNTKSKSTNESISSQEEAYEVHEKSMSAEEMAKTIASHKQMIEMMNQMGIHHGAPLGISKSLYSRIQNESDNKEDVSKENTENLQKESEKGSETSTGVKSVTIEDTISIDVIPIEDYSLIPANDKKQGFGFNSIKSKIGSWIASGFWIELFKGLLGNTDSKEAKETSFTESNMSVMIGSLNGSGK